MPVRSGVLDRRYVFEYDLGQWTFGTTQVLRERQSGALKACKTVPKAIVKGQADTLSRLQKLQKLSHPHICSVTDVQEDQNNYFIISDAYIGGDVGDWMDRLDDSQWWLVEQTVATYIGQVVAALAYCHSQQVYHRDLRPSSILLTSKMPDATILVSDFGLAEIFDPNHTFTQTNPTPYVAPELRSESGRVAGGAPDVWSVGAIAYALLIGHPPNDEGSGFDLSPSRLFRGAPDRDAWAGRSASSRSFVRRLLRPAGDRPTAARVLQHPWLKGVVLPRTPSGSAPESSQELRQKMVCYMAAVLLVPAEVPSADFSSLRTAFVQADHDYDGLTQRSTALELLLNMAGTEASSSSPGKADVDEALELVDVRGTGILDLCALACAAVLARLLRTMAREPLPLPQSPSARRSARAGELRQRAVERFFEVYGDDHSRSAISASSLSERLRTQTGHGMEAYAGVSYDEVLSVFPDEGSIDRRTLASELATGSGRGTPLCCWCDPVTHEVDPESCWEPTLSMDGLDSFLRGAWLSCGIGAQPRRRSGSKKLEPDCVPPHQCFGDVGI
uniref:Protein kinase domain-containing protein n=1 Tax=Pyrodinium bahamense TaxID=73915 RepID=A0A7S0AKK2_9DINO